MLHILEEHAARYPKMLPQDAVKLVYQSEFGPGHIIQNAGNSLQRLLAEWKACRKDAAAGEPKAEDIGGGYCRIYLNGLDQHAVLALHEIHIASAAGREGSATRMRDKLAYLQAQADAGALPFSGAALEAYLRGYTEMGLPMVSHSQAYKDAYQPAYRIVSWKYAAYFKVFSATEKLLAEKQRVRMAIDGRCGSGKTYLAARLREIYRCNVIPMDHFFLPACLRTEARLREPGGNIHYERFAAEAIEPLMRNEAITYRVFDCGKMDYTGSIHLPPAPLTICEGTYSMHPSYANVYNLKIFLHCDADLQKARIAKRDGQEALPAFINRWIPLEEVYFAACQTEKESDIIIRAE